MATLEQLEEGIRRAHAAGNADHVKALGAAYRQMQGQGASAPTATGPTIKVGGRTMSVAEYQAMPDADRQALRSQIADANPGLDLMANANGERTGPADWIVPAAQGMALGWADEGASLIHAGSEALQGRDFGSAYDHSMTQYKGMLDLERANNPLGSMAAEIGGAVAPALLTGGATLLPQGTTMAARVGLGALSAGTQGAIYGAGASAPGNRAQGAVTGGLAGAAVGGAVPIAGNAISSFLQKSQQGRVLDAAARVAPTADDLKSAASNMFEQATGGTPLAIADTSYMRFLGDVQQFGQKLRINPNLDQKSIGLWEMMQSIADDVAQGGVVIDMKDMHLLRQAAQRVSMSSEGRDAAFANTVINKLDDFVQTLKPADILGGADPSQATKALFDGISTWSRANKVSLIEEAIRIGQSQAAGPEKGIRNTLRRMLFNKPDVWRRFNAAEQQAIKDVIDGTPGSNLMKLVGTFGFGGNTATNGIGGAAGMALGGMAGGPLGMVAGPVIGSIGRNASERMTESLAQRALGAAATEGLKVVPRIDPNTATPIEMLLRKSLTPGVGGLVAPR